MANPWTEYKRIYTADYYSGRGADPLVDYVFELEHPEETIRVHEWRGIFRAVASLVTLTADTRWLDYGCGNGGLVRHLRERGIGAATGFDEGWIAAKARASGIPILQADALDRMTGQFDVVTAIEVLEHLEQPVDVMRRIRRLLKAGGLLFFTTGNAEPVRGRLLGWRYLVPEVHVSFFEPSTAARALRQAGFEPEFHGMLPGFPEIIRFKALKNLGLKRREWWQEWLPWPVLARMLDRRLRITAHPVGRVPR